MFLKAVFRLGLRSAALIDLVNAVLFSLSKPCVHLQRKDEIITSNVFLIVRYNVVKYKR